MFHDGRMVLGKQIDDVAESKKRWDIMNYMTDRR